MIGSKNRWLVGLVALMLLVAVAGCQPATPTPASPAAPTSPATTQEPAGLSGELSLAGSTSVQPLAETLAEAFMAQNPDVTIDVQGGGSSVGVTSAGQGTVDIGMASRAIKDSEMQEFPNLQVFTIAYDGIAIVVHPDVQLGNLTLEQVRGIFGGQITNFRQVGGPDAPIVVVSREEGSGTRGAFEEMVMKAGGTEVPIAASAILQQSNGAVRTTVAETPNSIAYLSFGFLDESVRAVPVEGVAPTMENVLNRSYPIFRPFNLLTNGAPGPLAQAFIGFVLSAEGQQIVAGHYIPVGQ